MTAAVRVARPVRREQLLDVALAAVVEDGFDGLSMEAIARRAGVDRVVVYRSFAGLPDLLAALLRRERRRTARRLDALIPLPGGGDPAAVLLDGLAGWLRAVEAEPLTWRLALLPPESAPQDVRAAIDRRRAAVQRRLRPLAAWAAAGLPGDVDAELLARTLLTLCEEHGRLLLEGFDRERLLASARALLTALDWR